MYENLFSYKFHINLLQDWNQQDTKYYQCLFVLFLFVTSVCQKQVMNDLLMPDYWSKK